MKSPAVLAILVGVSGALGLAFLNLNTESSPTREAHAPRVTEPAPKMAGRTLPHARSQPVEPVEVQAEKTTVAVTDSPNEEETLDEEPRTPEEVAFEHRETFENDSPATSATRALEGSIEDSVEQLATPGVQIQKVECRATRCRASIRFDAHETDIDAMEELTQRKESPFSRYPISIPERIVAADGSREAVVYLQLDG